MTTAQRDTIVQRVAKILDERVNIARWFRHNACQKHGLPLDDNEEVRIVVEGNSQAATPLVASPPAAAPAEQAGLLRWLGEMPSWAKTATVLAGGLGAGYAANNYFDGDESKPAATIEQPAELPAATGSLLQDLEDRGFHVAGDE